MNGKDLKLRADVGEQCGFSWWVSGRNFIYLASTPANPLFRPATRPADLDGVNMMEVPNYPESLDACSEFEKLLSGEEFEDYVGRLMDMMKKFPVTERQRRAFCSSPKERCLAFLAVKKQKR